MHLHHLLAAAASGLVLGTTASPLAATKDFRRHVPETHVLHERHTPALAARWSRGERLDPAAMIPVRIGLKQFNLDAGHDRLLEMMDKEAAGYGKHMTAEEVIDFFAPPASVVDAVREWVSSSGIAKERVGHSTNKQWIQFDATTEEVEGLLFADFHVWRHEDGFEDISTDAYHIPSDIKDHVDYITPGTRLRPVKRTPVDSGSVAVAVAPQTEKRNIKDHVKAFHSTPLAGQPQPFNINATSCASSIVAECLRRQYGIPENKRAARDNELGVFESLDDHYSKHDLDVFFKTVYPGVIPQGTYPINKPIDGAVGAIEDPSQIPITAVGIESSLDFDAAIPLIYPQKTVLFQTDDEYYESTGDFSGFWNTFLDALDGSYCTSGGGNCKTPDCIDPTYPDPNAGGYKGKLQCGVYKPTNVLSISYGAWGLPDAYFKRQCNELMKLGLQGVTVVVSSGDSGVGDESVCQVGADGKTTIFYTTMMAECPYVLSVGSTELNRFSNTTAPKPYEKLNEIATRRFASGGGFSNIFKMPDWQKGAVNGYLSSVYLPFGSYNTPVKDNDFSKVKGGRFHRGGRAYPDIAAIGDRQVVYAGGLWYHVGGTSLSAPVVASMVTLVNEARLAAGKKPVGFFTPALYAHPGAFNDITVGSNPGCDSPGFPATRGWDPVTGLGSPIYPEFAALLQNL